MDKIKLEDIKDLDRLVLQKLGVYANLTEKFINQLGFWLQSKDILDIMTGRGLLPQFLMESNYNIGITATDNYAFKSVNTGGWDERDVEPIVEKLDALKAVEYYGKKIDFLIIAWPDQGDKAYKSIKKLYQINKDAYVIFVGEKSDQKNRKMADEQFFKHFEILPSEDFHEIVVKHYDSGDFNDQPYLGRYSSQPENTIDDYYDLNQINIVHKNIYNFYKQNNERISLLSDPQKVIIDAYYRQAGLSPYSDSGELPEDKMTHSESYEEEEEDQD